MAAHRYWRVYITAINGGTSASIAELEMRESIGGSDVTGSGTATASSQFSGTFVPSRAFDNNTSTAWASLDFSTPQWLKYDFGSGSAKDIVELAITRRPQIDQAPVTWTLDYSDDDSTWTTLYRIGGEADWNSTVRTFSASSYPDVSGENQYFWRLRSTAVDGGTCVAMAELRMYTNPLGANECTGGTPYSSSIFEAGGPDYEAFDGVGNDGITAGSYWAGMTTAEWIGYKFASAKAITTIAVVARTTFQNQAPKDFLLEYWNGSSYTTAMTISGITGWTTGQTRWFNSTGEISQPVAVVRPVVCVCC